MLSSIAIDYTIVIVGFPGETLVELLHWFATGPRVRICGGQASHLGGGRSCHMHPAWDIIGTDAGTSQAG